MTETLIKKNLKLSHEFDTYVSNHRGVLKSLSGGAHVILTSDSDPKLSEANLALARRSRARRLVIAHKSKGGWRIKEFAR
jgi:hypothetical protein